MNLVPRYNLPIGVQVTLHRRVFVATGRRDAGYSFVDVEAGSRLSVTFEKFVRLIKAPGFSVDRSEVVADGGARARLDGYGTAEELPTAHAETARFRLALGQAVEVLQGLRESEPGGGNYRVSIRKLDERANREMLRDILSEDLGWQVMIDPPRGGRIIGWAMPAGGKLMDYFNAYSAVGEGVDPLDAVASGEHRKGNRNPRLPWITRELMSQAWEKVGLDKKGTNIANVLRKLEDLIAQHNETRIANELPCLVVPSRKTLSNHRAELLTDTEYAIAILGEKTVRARRGRGGTDLRSLFIGEYVEIDECKASLVMSSKANGTWSRLSAGQKRVLKKIDDQIRERFTILVMIDVATRMVLAWVISDGPRTDATLALLRMATRDKTREKVIYGCEGDPAHAVGLGNVMNDNGTALRNPKVKEAVLGVGGTSTDAKTYSPSEKPFVEGMFGTTQSVLFSLIHGYTGTKPGELPDYDAVKNGVLDIDQIYGIMTRFFIDEYPSMRHQGFGVGGRRPAELYDEINRTRGHFAVMDPDDRRIHLGWEERVTPTDEGVRVFRGLWYNSNDFQAVRDRFRGKVRVFIDLDDVTLATVIVPGHKGKFTLRIQSTAFADLTLPRVLALVASWRSEDPRTTRIHDDRLLRTRRQRAELLEKIGVENKLPRSYSTFDECRRKANAVFAGVQVVGYQPVHGSVSAGNVMSDDETTGLWRIGCDRGQCRPGP